jgi:Domain of unknown function (DUF4185)
MRDFRRLRSRPRSLAVRIVLCLPLALWAVGVLQFSDENGGSGNPRLEAHAVTPFGADTAGAPVVVAARLVCSLANEDAAAASIKEFDGVTSVVAGGESFWLFGDSWLTRKRGGYLFANATVAKSADSDASDCVSLAYKASGGIAEPLLALEKGESTAWPDGAIAIEAGNVDFYFASVKRTSSTKWNVTAIGLARFDTRSMNSRRLVEHLWDNTSEFGDAIRGARSPVLQGRHVFVFLHTTTNRLLLARVPMDSMAMPGAYSYWNGTSWSFSLANAKALWPETASDIPTQNGLSVRYNDFLGKWLAVYDRDLSTISVRVADSLTGPWSSEVQWLDCKTLFPSSVWPPCYYAEQHVELSGDEGRTIYVTVSSAPPYDVYLLELRLGAAVHQWRDDEGRVVYGTASPRDGYADEGVSFYASDREVPGFEPIYVWTATDGERIYSTQQPGQAFNRGDAAFYAPNSSQVAGSIVPYVPVYRWDVGTDHLYSTATTGLENQGYLRGDVAFYAVCGDANMDGVGDCLE